MDTLSLNSIAIPTFLMAVGLFFFIRASVKDRTEVLHLGSNHPPEAL
ncbi:MAG: cofactor assembly of complex C subunit B, partial [Sodalinema sp.]